MGVVAPGEEKKLVWTGKCFGMKQRQLLSVGNLLSCGVGGGGGDNFVTPFWKRGQNSVTQFDKGVGVNFTRRSFDIIY